MSNFKERLKKRSVSGITYAVSDKGLHILMNGFKEFIIPKQQMLIINGQLFEQEIKQKEDEDKSDTRQS